MYNIPQVKLLFCGRCYFHFDVKLFHESFFDWQTCNKLKKLEYVFETEKF